MNIAKAANGLRQDSYGIWISPERATVSYPTQGNEECFAIEDRSYWFRHRNDCIVSVVRRFPPSGCILDIGGGNGYVTRRLIDEGFAATLLEPGPVGARNGRVARQLPEVICSTLEDAGLPPRSIPAAGCFDVIEHIEDDGQFVSRLHALLEPGGLLYGTVPAHNWLWSLSDITAGHHRRFNKRQLIKLLQPIGYRVEYFSYFFMPLALPLFVLRSLPFRLHLFHQRSMLRPETEHGTGRGLLPAAIDRLLSLEGAQIDQGGTLPIGTSCLFVARKDH